MRSLFDEDYYKPIRTDGSFGGNRNSYIEYMKKICDMIRPYLRDLINRHKPTTELTDEASNDANERGEWKLQLVMQNNCIFTENFKETRTIY